MRDHLSRLTETHTHTQTHTHRDTPKHRQTPKQNTLTKTQHTIHIDIQTNNSPRQSHIDTHSHGETQTDSPSETNTLTQRHIHRHTHRHIPHQVSVILCLYLKQFISLYC